MNLGTNGISPFKHSTSLVSPFFKLLVKLFYGTREFFLCLEFSRGSTVAAEIGQAVVDLKLEVK